MNDVAVSAAIDACVRAGQLDQVNAIGPSILSFPQKSLECEHASQPYSLQAVD